MSARPLLPGEAPAVAALTEPGLRAMREQQVQGISRRRLLRTSLGLGIGVWLAELAGGSISFLWAAATAGAKRVRVGTLDQLVAANPGLPIRDGFPAYVPDAKAFVVLVDPAKRGFLPGVDAKGDGVALNVRALSQRCPHLGCRPNPCLDDFWFHCPCHKSRYDRLGIKGAGTSFGPAPHSMDRFAIEVDANGALTIDTGRITLGPLPVAVGQPGIIPPLVENACG
jgi:cytochrome b6-f complex iron-sulfur subunit